MSIRLDPRRLGTLKHLAGEAGVRPGDLVRQWVEERIDAQRAGPGGLSLEDRVEALEERIAALTGAGLQEAEPIAHTEPAASEEVPAPNQEEERPAVGADEAAAAAAALVGEAAPAARRRRVAATPSDRVALHDEMIAVLAERGPLPAGELATAIAERGRYAPPRSGRPLDAAMVSQRASNPTYRSRFQRREGRIGLADEG